MQRIKVLIVGDGAVDKSCLFVTFTTKVFPEDYVPTIFDNYDYNYLYEGEPFSIGLWDTRANEEYDRLRPLSYPQTDVFLISYAVNSPPSFQNAKERWIPEIKFHMENTPIVVVGLKSDLKYDADPQGDSQYVSEEDGLELARGIGAYDFFEVSSKTYSNVDELFNRVIDIFKHNKSRFTLERKQKGCFIC